MKALKKLAVRHTKKEKKMENLKNGSSGGKKLSKEEKDKLYEIFVGRGKETRYAPMKSTSTLKSTMLSRAKSPGRMDRVQDEEK